MKTNSTMMLLAMLLLGSSQLLHAQTTNATVQDNRFISVAISATNPSYTSRNYAASDYQLNSMIHFNARIAKSDGTNTASVQNPTPFPSATPSPSPTPTPAPTATPVASTPTPTPTATPAAAKTPKPAKRPKHARDQARYGNW